VTLVHRSLRLTIFALGLATAIAPRSANAQTADAPQSVARVAHAGDGHFQFTDHPAVIDGVVGFGTPVGLIGAALQYDLASWLAIGAGAGTNIAGLQLAALTRLRPWTRTTPALASGVTLGLALATGKYGGRFASGGLVNVDHSYAQRYVVGQIGWAHLDLGWELKMRSGFHLLAAGGVAMPIGAEGGHCEDRNTGARGECSDYPESQKPAMLGFVATLMVGTSF
jgi:hypothetical protein